MKGFIFCLWMLLPLAGALAEEKADKEKAFRETRELIESNRFRITAIYAYSSGGRSISLIGNEGTLTVRDSVAEGFFPFFGRAYRAPIGTEGGIRFDGEMEQKRLTVKEKRKNSYIRYEFRVRGANDVYDISIDVFGGGHCTINIYSNNRSTISYQGETEPIEQ